VIHKIADPRMQQAVNAIASGDFGDPSTFYGLLDALIPSRDYYLLGEDFGAYIDAHNIIDQTFKNKSKWAKMSILSTAGMGKFTSDRSVKEYAEKVWNIKPSPPSILKTRQF
jgi:starch phosphorylase